jgi:glycosyltransferase involved in cell wall biosynthesis
MLELAVRPARAQPTRALCDLAVLILTFNEEENLRDCIDSVLGWASEIFVIDSYSTDATVDIALSYSDRGVRVVQHTFEDYAKQWNWAISRLPVRCSWSLKLDADERATAEFRNEVGRVLTAAPDDLQGVYFRRRFFFMRRPLTRSGSIGYDLRLWRTGAARFEDRSVNEHAMVEGRACYLKAYVNHVDMKPISDWLDKHNRYSSLEARNYLCGNVAGDVPPRFWGTPDQRRMWWRVAYNKVPGAPAIYFLYLYVLRGGFLDGVGGFRYCLLRAQYRYWIELKIREHRELKTLPPVTWPARGIPHPAVVHSDLQQIVDAGTR